MAANEVSYEWREDSLGEYSRPLYGSEVMFAAASTVRILSGTYDC